MSTKRRLVVWGVRQIRRVGEFVGCWSGADSIIFYISFMTDNGRNLLDAEPQWNSWPWQRNVGEGAAVVIIGLAEFELWRSNLGKVAVIEQL